MRRFIITVILAVVAVIAVGGAVLAGTGGGSSVTQARLERSLPTEFANLYAQQAKLLGHKGVTPDSLDAKAMCDKGGAVEANVGPGSNWNCLVSWTDQNNPMPPEGYGKFELDVHSNGCYTAGGPSKLVGFQTITDAKGDEVNNPVYEFDGCFDPNGDNTPTQVELPSLTTVTTTALSPDADEEITLQLSCGTGATGCQGTVDAKAGDTDLGTVPFNMLQEQTAKLHFPSPVPTGADSVDFTLTVTKGTGPKGPVTETSLDMPPS
jgi:type II secretory pathway pseudopilin PulG